MKNSFKIGLLALTVSAAAVACKGKNNNEGGDTTSRDSVTQTVTDTTKKDTSTLPDSLKKDTTIRTTTVKEKKTTIKEKPGN